MIWQSIETAPKDGTPVLLFYPMFRRPEWIGTYEIYETFAHGKSQGKREYWSTGIIGISRAEKEAEPTHWMPLPAPPSDIAMIPPMTATSATST